MLDGLHCSRERGEPDQLTLLLGRLAEQTGTTDDLAGVLAGRAPMRGQLDALVTGETRRTLSVLACLPTSWALIREHAADRFRVLGLRAALPSERIAGELVATRLGARCERRLRPALPDVAGGT